MNNAPSTPTELIAERISIDGVEFIWPSTGGIRLFGVDSILFWLKPSLMSVLQPISEELGEDLYSKLLAFEASRGTYEDYHIAILGNGANFEEGFEGWSRVVSHCGWGNFIVEKIDWQAKCARIRVTNPWEMKIYSPQHRENEIPFLRGKISGIFSHAFGTNCLASLASETHSDGSILLEVSPSLQTLEQALLETKSRRANSPEGDLRSTNNSLRRSERRFNEMIDAAGKCVWECDLSFHITYATANAHEMLGPENGALLGKPWLDLIHAKDEEAFKHLLSKAVGEEKFSEGEFLLNSGEINNRWILIRCRRLLDFSDHHIGYVGSARDISNEKRLTEQLAQQRQQAEFAAKMATLGEMAGGIAHEINTPLAVIALQAEQLLVAFSGKNQSDTEEARSAQMILATIDRIAKIISGLRSFSRDATNDPKIEVPLSQVFQDTLLLCKNRLKSSDVTLQFADVAPDLTIRCRATELCQVFLNLLNNSFDAVAPLQERWIEVGANHSGGKIKIEFKDSGTGIPAHIREKLMQPFFTTKPVGQGTGMGLSISKGIVESHGGHLYIDTDSPNTCFVVELPVS